MSKQKVSVLIFLFVVIASRMLFSAEIKTGDTAPKIILRDINNKIVITSNILKEKPLLISFFFTACVPCKKEIPELERLNKIYGGKIKMFLIATDKEGQDTVKPYADEMKISIEILIDKYSDIASLYNVTKYPATFIIGIDGKIKYSCSGFKEDNMKIIENFIKNLK